MERLVEQTVSRVEQTVVWYRKCRRRAGQMIYCPCRLLGSLNFIPKATGSQKIVLHRGT